MKFELEQVSSKTLHSVEAPVASVTLTDAVINRSLDGMVAMRVEALGISDASLRVDSHA